MTGAADERALAVVLFDHTWELLERRSRTPEETDELVHAAHASRYHWGRVGTAANRARGEWLCARVYATLGRAEPALHHARRCLELVEAGAAGAGQEGFEDWDLASARQALAHAHLAAGEQAEASRWATLARRALAEVEDGEDRAVVEGQLAELGL